jgi:ectoine hydroxylase-related dioxygenase (phytanoyl-CoA dioxygenase family)
VAALVAGRLAACASDALGETALAFKDKLNYKQPGGAGFSPHQDKVAYPGAGRVLSLLVAVDDCTIESGCLWMAGGVDRVLPVDARGVVRDDVTRELEWEPAELRAGDGVCIDGLAPHYSEANRSALPRCVLVASYAPAREGYTRDDYYARRGSRMRSATERDGRFRISTLADFDGMEVPVDASAAPVGTCSHPPART